MQVLGYQTTNFVENYQNIDFAQTRILDPPPRLRIRFRTSLGQVQATFRLGLGQVQARLRLGLGQVQASTSSFGQVQARFRLGLGQVQTRFRLGLRLVLMSARLRLSLGQVQARFRVGLGKHSSLGQVQARFRQGAGDPKKNRTFNRGVMMIRQQKVKDNSAMLQFSFYFEAHFQFLAVNIVLHC